LITKRKSKRAVNRRDRQNKAPAQDLLESKFFNSVAGRPYPSIPERLNRITVPMTVFVPSFLTTSTTVPHFVATSFQINQFDLEPEYLALFDQYKIDIIELWLEPNIPANTGVAWGELATCIDLDDATIPTTVNSVAGHPGALVGQGSQGRYHKFIPHIAVAAYNGSFGGFLNSAPCWIDSASSNVQHFGFKVAAGATGAAVVSYNLTIRAQVSFKNPGI